MQSIQDSNYFYEPHPSLISLPNSNPEGISSNVAIQSIAQASLASSINCVEGQVDDDQPGLYPDLEGRVSLPSEEGKQNQEGPSIIARLDPFDLEAQDLIVVNSRRLQARAGPVNMPTHSRAERICCLISTSFCIGSLAFGLIVATIRGDLKW
jgi:hypothetical protein